MSHSRFRQLSFQPWHVLGLAIVSACATGVTEEFEDEPTNGNNNGGSLSTAGNAGTTSVVPKAGSTGSGGGGNPFGGSTSTGGKASAGSAGSDVGEGGAAMNEGGAAGTGGSSAGSGGASAGSGGSGGSGTGPCGCGKTLAWADNTVLNWVTGDCLTVTVEMVTTTYKYIGTKAQTYANGQCNPSKQEAWCPDAGNDYKFMICP